MRGKIATRYTVTIVKTVLDGLLTQGGDHAKRTSETRFLGVSGHPEGPFGLVSGGSDARSAVGYSEKLSFDEAFADALAHLLPAETTHPNQMEIIQVTHVGAEFGGMVPVSRLIVRIIAISQ
jgi:hypothetical protein